MAKPTTELAKDCPAPPYMHWDQRGKKPVLLSDLTLINKKKLRLSFQTDDPDIAKRYMRLLVPCLVAQGRLLANGGAAELYGAGGRSHLKKVDAEIRRLKRRPEAKFGPQALATAKRRRLPVGVIHCLAERKPALNAQTYRTRRMRARERGTQIAKGASWHYRRVGGKCFYLNGGVMNARLEVAGRKYMWPLPTRDRDEAAAIMEPIRVARERVREAAKRRLEYELGSVEYADAVRALEKECITMAAAIIDAGGPIELGKAVQDPPPGEDGTALPKVVKAKPMKQAAREKCINWLVDLILTSPDGPTGPRRELEQNAKAKFGVLREDFRAYFRVALKNANPPSKSRWRIGGRRSHN
ncbi:MAG TPA: hypothetical protein VEK55_10430 [Xanthobacteraceae bacterium]|nr:hypothetical protein [Xanthobacteraceae bacterium]